MIRIRSEYRDEADAREPAINLFSEHAHSRVGQRARRRRRVTACISWLLIALMTVGPERVYALSVEAQAHAAYAKAVAAGVLAQAVPGKFDWSYGYDENGNLETTEKRDSTGTVVQADGYTYDGQDHLTTHSLGGALDVTYAYDADGIRTWSKKAGADPIYFLTDKNRPYAQVIEERTWLDPADPDNPDPEDALLAVRYTYGDDLIAQERVIDPAANPHATTRSYYHYDGQLSTRMLTDGQAAPDTPSTAPPTVTDTYTYDAFGNLLDATTDDGTPTTNNYRYTGEQYDPNLGFYYLRARYYDQAVGRFTTRDTFDGLRSKPVTLHRYLYAGANPVDKIDPSGREISIAGQAGVAGISTYIQAALLAQTIKIALALAITDIVRQEAFLWHVMDKTIFDIAVTYNAGALRTTRGPPMYFAGGITPFANTPGWTFAPPIVAALISIGLYDRKTKAAIAAFALDLGVVLSPKLSKPSRHPVLIQTARTGTPGALRFAGGIRVVRDFPYIPGLNLFTNTFRTVRGEIVPITNYAFYTY